MRQAACVLLVGLLVPSLMAAAEPRVKVIADAASAGLRQPFGVERGAGGTLYIVEYAHRVTAVAPNGKAGVLAGDGAKGDAGDGGPAAAAKLNAPHAIALGADGALYVADTLNHRVRRIDPKTKVITTVAGSARGFAGDGGPAEEAQFNGIYCIAFNPDRSKLVITDLENRRVRVMDVKTRVVTTVAGNGQRGVPADGAVAAEAPLVDPRAAAMDSKGNVYVLERGGHALRVVLADGKVRTLLPGPKGPRAPSELRGPKHLVIDGNDDLIIADTDHHRVVKWVAKEGKVIVLAGTGKAGPAVDAEAPLRTEFNQPHGVYVDRDGAILVSDSMNHRIVRVAP